MYVCMYVLLLYMVCMYVHHPTRAPDLCMYVCVITIYGMYITPRGLQTLACSGVAPVEPGSAHSEPPGKQSHLTAQTYSIE